MNNTSCACIPLDGHHHPVCGFHIPLDRWGHPRVPDHRLRELLDLARIEPAALAPWLVALAMDLRDARARIEVLEVMHKKRRGA